MYSVGGTGWKPCPRNHDGSFRSRLDFLGDIAVGDLGAEEDGRDETQGCYDSKHDHMLITGPREGVFLTGEIKKNVEGDCSQNEEEGDKHRR